MTAKLIATQSLVGGNEREGALNLKNEFIAVEAW